MCEVTDRGQIGTAMLYRVNGEIPKFTVIEQPGFFSWYGYFGLIAVSDIFVFYDDVQFERRSWQIRNRITQRDGTWTYINVPVAYADRSTLIKDMHISYESPWREKLLDQLNYEYNNMPYYKEYIGKFKAVLYQDFDLLADLNISLIKNVCEMLNLDAPEFIRSSEIQGVQGRKTDRLVSIMEHLGEKNYLSLTGARGYIIPEKFVEKAQELYWYEFEPKRYEQGRGDFISHMSIVDLLFRMGREKTKNYIYNIAVNSVTKDTGDFVEGQR